MRFADLCFRAQSSLNSSGLWTLVVEVGGYAGSRCTHAVTIIRTPRHLVDTSLFQKPSKYWGIVLRSSQITVCWSNCYAGEQAMAFKTGYLLKGDHLYDGGSEVVYCALTDGKLEFFTKIEGEYRGELILTGKRCLVTHLESKNDGLLFRFRVRLVSVHIQQTRLVEGEVEEVTLSAATESSRQEWTRALRGWRRKYFAAEFSDLRARLATGDEISVLLTSLRSARLQKASGRKFKAAVPGYGSRIFDIALPKPLVQFSQTLVQ